MDKNYKSPPRVLVDQVSDGDQTGPGSVSEIPVSGREDVLLLHDLPDGFTYRLRHDLFRPYGTVLQIRLVHSGNGSTNKCYVSFSSSAEPKSAIEVVGSLETGATNLRPQLQYSRNLSETDYGYVTNIDEESVKKSSTKVRETPAPWWFIGYYKDGTGNFIHASRYLNKEIDHIPPENLKKKG